MQLEDGRWFCRVVARMAKERVVRQSDRPTPLVRCLTLADGRCLRRRETVELG